MAHPDEAGVHEGLAYTLYHPEDGSREAGVVILHGAGSSRESHLDFARRCRAGGLSAIAFDMRGHGESPGRLDGRAIEDVATMAALLGCGRVGLRGSSMGGYFALVAARAARASAVVAICPAGAEGLRRGLRQGRFPFPADEEPIDALFAAHDEHEAATALGDGLLLMHAEGDETVPVEHSRELHVGAPGSRLIAVPGGHHRSVQHDAELQGEAVRFLARRLRAG